ncbi:unnamed protein product, partial [Staurois parvus]
PVPCDLCDHSQISHVVSNDIRSDILLTTLHVITDWPISDHMIGTSYRGPVRRSVFHCVSGHSGHQIEHAQAGCGEATRPCTATVWPFIYNGRMGSG